MIHPRLLFKRKVNLLMSLLFVSCVIYFSNSIHHQVFHLTTPIMATPDTTTTTLKNNKGVRISPLLQKQDKDDYNHPSSNTNEEEKYLAYLPHSGLSNQRIELANALLLSYMTNRTLIVPPAFLGSVFGWMQRDQLLDRLDWLTTPKAFTKICQSPTPGELATYVQRSRCSEYRQFAIMDWTEIHDFSPLTELGINIKFQQIFSMTQIKNDLQITNDERDIYLHQDTQLYDWRLYQNMTEAVDLLKTQMNYFDSFSGRRYYKVLMPHHFQRRQEKLLFLGGVFGSTRIHLIEPEDIKIQERIKAVLHYRMDTRIGDAVKRIVDYMGGKGTFMSVHFRTGDNPFRKEIGNNLRIFRENMTQLLVQEEHYHDLQQLNERQQSTEGITEEEDTGNIHNVLEENAEVIDSTESATTQCLNIVAPSDLQSITSSSASNFDEQTINRVKVYIATDHKDPRNPNRSQLLPWFRDFPCTTVLKDLPNYLFDPLDTMHDIVVPTKELRPFLIPIVDAMVAAHGRYVLTTPRSTFSGYIKELHDVWV